MPVVVAAAGGGLFVGQLGLTARFDILAVLSAGSFLRRIYVSVWSDANALTRTFTLGIVVAPFGAAGLGAFTAGSSVLRPGNTAAGGQPSVQTELAASQFRQFVFGSGFQVESGPMMVLTRMVNSDANALVDVVLGADVERIVEARVTSIVGSRLDP